MAKNKFLDKIRNGQPARGVWLGIPSVHSVRLLARLPLDWMIIDMEHSPTSLDSMVGMVAAVTEADGPQPVVRLSQASRREHQVCPGCRRCRYHRTHDQHR